MPVAIVLDVLDHGRALWTAVAWLGAAAIALALALPAVWWEPLHADEIVTQAFARGSPADIVQNVFVERGGAPLHFLVERATLVWPDGLLGLRVPSIVFFLIALPAAGLVARLLVDARAAVLLPLALACAPLAVELSTFGRMYSLLLAATLWSTALALWAARRGGLLAWTLCGVGAGLLVYVHPVALLYSALVVLTGLLCATAPPGRLLRTAWAAPVALAAVQVPYYLFAVGKLSDRYRLELDAPRVQGIGEEGRSVAEEALVALGPGGLAGSFFALGLAFAGLAWLGAVRPRTALVLALWLVVPAAFFTFVPTETNWFLPRLLLPVLPFFLLLAVSGCLALTTFGRVGAAGAALAFAGLLAWQLADDARRLDGLADLRLPTLAVEAERHGPVLVFGSVGEGEEAGRPGKLLDEYVFLERPTASRAPESDPETLAAFVADGSEPVDGRLDLRRGGGGTGLRPRAPGGGWRRRGDRRVALRPPRPLERASGSPAARRALGRPPRGLAAGHAGRPRGRAAPPPDRYALGAS